MRARMERMKKHHRSHTGSGCRSTAVVGDDPADRQSGYILSPERDGNVEGVGDKLGVLKVVERTRPRSGCI